MFGLADRYYDALVALVDPNCKQGCRYTIAGANSEGVLKGDIMGVDARTGDVTKAGLAAIGNKILSSKKSDGVLVANGLNLDVPKSLPPLLPVTIDPKQADELAGYSSRSYEPNKKVVNKKE